MKHFSVLLVLLSVTGVSVAATIHVPANQPTIQAGINAAKNGDRVVVARGTYFENINFAGKAITVVASGGRTVTIIDGGHAGRVVTFDSGEGRESVLEGFTVQNGNASLEGGGIYIFNASPTIKLNTVTNNVACGSGAGIAVEFSSALVQNNVISSNSESGCTGGLGGGLYVGGAGSALVTGNTIQKNSATFGGGMALFATTTPTLENNVIHGNVATDQTSQGGGLWIVDSSEALLVQNLIYNNTATQGAGAYVSVSGDTPGPTFINNTIVGTASSLQSSALYASISQQGLFYNNLMIGASGTSAVYCYTSLYETTPIFTNNDAYSPNGAGLTGSCASQSGQTGNLSVNPMFVAAANFRLRARSPAIDAGDNAAPDLPPLDLAGKPRIVDGNGGGTAIIDMGAYEYQPPASSSVIPDQR